MKKYDWIINFSAFALIFAGHMKACGGPDVVHHWLSSAYCVLIVFLASQYIDRCMVSILNTLHAFWETFEKHSVFLQPLHSSWKTFVHVLKNNFARELCKVKKHSMTDIYPLYLL